MDSIGAYLEELLSRLEVDPARREEIRLELEEHLRELVAHYVGEGHSKAAAERLAARSMRTPDELARELSSVPQPPARLPWCQQAEHFLVCFGVAVVGVLAHAGTWVVQDYVRAMGRWWRLVEHGLVWLSVENVVWLGALVVLGWVAAARLECKGWRAAAVAAGLASAAPGLVAKSGSAMDMAYYTYAPVNAVLAGIFAHCFHVARKGGAPIRPLLPRAACDLSGAAWVGHAAGIGFFAGALSVLLFSVWATAWDALCRGASLDTITGIWSSVGVHQLIFFGLWIGALLGAAMLVSRAACDVPPWVRGVVAGAFAGVAGTVMGATAAFGMGRSALQVVPQVACSLHNVSSAGLITGVLAYVTSVAHVREETT